MCNDNVSASDSGCAAMISAVIFPTVAKIYGLQQYASKGLPWQEEQRADGCNSGQLKVGSYIECLHECQQQTVSLGHLSFLYFARNGETKTR
jgi:hypothetical protein